ncbi:MAG: hypothetical protein J4G05_11950 [Chlorobi bacterium]|nr:hypothetical protein [Chlorobiota bacterium]
MSDIQEHKRRRIRWMFGAATIALALWGILSLSQTYSWNIEVPLEPEIDTTEETLAEPIPEVLNVTVRADGWTLMQIVLGSNPICRLSSAGRPVSSNDTLRIYSFNERDLINSIDLPSSVQLENVRPGSIRMPITDIASKKVPLYYPDLSINTRDGFQVIGAPSVWPDSVWVSGSAEALENITRWYMTPLKLNDVFERVRTSVPLSDSLHGALRVSPEVATVSADVQEVAEVTFEDIPITNRGALTDTTTVLLLYPDRITITLRGGATELGQITKSTILPYIQLIPGVDTSGFVRPRISLPSDRNATVIAVVPKRIRYVWRKVVPTTGEER